MDMRCHLIMGSHHWENDVMDKTQTINVAYDRVSLLLQFSACQCMCCYDHEIIQLPDTGGMPCVYQTSQRNWVTILMLYRYFRMCLLGSHGSRLGFVTPSNG